MIRNQHAAAAPRLRGLKREGFRHVHVLDSPEEVDAATIERQPLWNNKRTDEHGPFDIIGDVHGCATSSSSCSALLGYGREEREGEFPDGGPVYAPPRGAEGGLRRRPRRPRAAHPRHACGSCANMVERGTAHVRARQPRREARAQAARPRRPDHARPRPQSLAELDALPDDRAAAHARSSRFLDGLVSHYVLDDGKLVVAHAGMKEEMQGRGSGKVRDFALYGETTGETDEFGLPVR